MPSDQAAKERDFLASKYTQQTQPDRYKSLCKEAEYLTNNFAEAENYMKKITEVQEGDPEAMMQMGRFYMRFGKIEKADEHLRDAYSFNIKNQRYGLIYACYLIKIGRTKEASIIL